MTTSIHSSLSQSTHHTTTQKGMVMLVFALGAFLRFWQLGQKNYWMDELGVAEAASKPTLAQVLEIAHSHIMAMPLDYVVVWLAGHISQTQVWLRFPEALWGIATLSAGYQLYTYTASRRVAFFAILMLALSPILITYSQELRFYASLVFFYTLSTYFGVKAVNGNEVRDWVSFTLLTITGIFFHFYAVLAVVNVLLWLITYFGRDNWRSRRNHFALSMLFMFTGFLTGLSLFGGVYAENRISLFQYQSFQSLLLIGLGWMPPFPAPEIAYGFGGLMMVTAILGMYRTLITNRLGLPAIFLYSAVLQIILIIVLNFIRNYFLHARQIIILVPVMTYFSALGTDWLIEKISNQHASHPRLPALLSGLGTAMLCLAALPVLTAYYQVNKGSLTEIRSLLMQNWHSPEPIHVEAGVYDVYSYYWSQNPDDRLLVHAMRSMDYNTSNGWDEPEPAWFITSYPPTEELGAALRAAGFSPAFTPERNTLYPQMVWRRP